MPVLVSCPQRRLAPARKFPAHLRGCFKRVRPLPKLSEKWIPVSNYPAATESDDASNIVTVRIKRDPVVHKRSAPADLTAPEQTSYPLLDNLVQLRLLSPHAVMAFLQRHSEPADLFRCNALL